LVIEYIFQKKNQTILKIFFRYGQLSGLVEPVAGVLGALLVSYMQPILPYALAFAAGAMVYVVMDDIIPEAQTWYTFIF
jgi:zinc transporter 11